MEFLKNKQNLYILISAAVALVLVGGAVFWVNNSKTNITQDEEELEKIVLSEDLGIDIRGGDNGHELYMRYKLIDKTGEGENLGIENSINISNDNAKIFLTNPDGTTENIASERWYVPVRFYPPQMSGTYKLRFEFDSGEVLRREIVFPEPKEVKLIEQELTREEIEHEGTDDESTSTLTAYSLEGVDLSKASPVMHLNPRGSMRTKESPGDNIDEYFWMDKAYLERSDAQKGKHIFLAKVDGVWHYATVNYPEDF
ncbi:MAG: hypothetical protein R3346_03395 [Candidatus Spechtbacterales bacterium]|nr:hypothetical protein [Candidatus Spechtbacterales bacterium]